jgi:tRNA threonylcarbamoyladenosine biosynthesis protein TsaE
VSDASAAGREAHGPLVPVLADHGALAMDESELRDWGHRFGRAAHPPLVVTLAGELGAGKTTLVQSICDGYGVTGEVTSPTFALVQEYDAPRSPVYHLDLYRLERADELTNIGWDEIVASDALVLIEWPDRAAARLPAAHVPIDLEHVAGDASRRLLLAG